MAKGYAMSTLGKDRTGKALGSGRCESEDKLCKRPMMGRCMYAVRPKVQPMVGSLPTCLYRGATGGECGLTTVSR